MYGEIIAAIQSVKTLSDLLKSARSLSNYNELVFAVSEVNTKLMEATGVALTSQEKQSQLVSRISELEKKLEEVEDWKRRISRYQLHEFPSGALAFALKKGMEQGEPFHYICVHCADKGHISRLQPSTNRTFLQCHPCKISIQVKEKPPAPSSKGGSWMTQ